MAITKISMDKNRLVNKYDFVKILIVKNPAKKFKYRFFKKWKELIEVYVFCHLLKNSY